MITASHNPEEYNGLKFFNSDGEFLSREDVNKLIKYSNLDSFDFSSNDGLGKVTKYDDLIDDHIDAIVNLEIFTIKRYSIFKTFCRC